MQFLSMQCYNYDMLQIIVGAIIILFPFILLIRFKNKVEGFAVLSSSLICTHIFVALVTQSSNTFLYSMVLGIHVVIACISLILFIRYRTVDSSSSTQNELPKKITHIVYENLFPALIILLGLFLLYTIRFNYTGVVDTPFGIRQVAHSSYTYPLYSDEWVGSALSNYSIHQNKLPLVNPLFKNEPFINFLVASHAVFAELLLVLSLNPFTQYIYLAILNSIALCIVTYFILLTYGVRKNIAIIMGLCILLITNSGNLPGAWFLLPYTASLTVFLLAIVGHQIKNRLVLVLSIIASLLLYPPMIVFIIPFLYGVYIDGGYKKISNLKQYLMYVLGMCIFVATTLLLFMSRSFEFTNLYIQAKDFIFRSRLDEGKVMFDIWNVIPMFIVPFIPIGLYQALKQKKAFLLAPVIAGTMFWIYYRLYSTVFLIEPSRVILITSILFLIFSGIGLEALYKYCLRNDIYSFQKDKILNFGIKSLISVFLVLFIVNFPKLSLWNKNPLTITTGSKEYTYIPAPPVTRYLTESDVSLFKSYSGKVFISPPWKGLVIGAVTGNFPLESKASTLTNTKLLYSVFMEENCEGKEKLIKKHKISLVYSTEIRCPNLVDTVGVSDEGLILSKTKSS